MPRRPGRCGQWVSVCGSLYELRDDTKRMERNLRCRTEHRARSSPMLAASRRLNEELSFTHGTPQNRSEKRQENMALFGKTACIVGLGGIGDLLLERLRGFGMILTGVDNTS